MNRQKSKRLKKLQKQMEIVNQSIIEEREWLKNHPPFKVDKGKVEPFPVY